MSLSQTEGGFTSYQKLVVALMAFLQFSIILDFMVMSPLGVMLMPALQITPSQFGLAVSVYAFSAGMSAILAAGFADRFDRKTLLLFFYAGFILGTFLCAIAPTFHFLLFGRIVTGIFGGVIGSVALPSPPTCFLCRCEVASWASCRRPLPPARFWGCLSASTSPIFGDGIHP